MPRGDTPRGTIFIFVKSVFKPEIFFGVVVADVLHYLAERIQLGNGILSVFNQVAEHIAQQPSVKLVAGIGKEGAAVGEHTDGLRHEADLHWPAFAWSVLEFSMVKFSSRTFSRVTHTVYVRNVLYSSPSGCGFFA